MKRFLAVLLICVLAAPAVHAQTCTENVLDGFNVEFAYGAASGGTIGQTFTACASGQVHSITIHEGTTSTAGAYSLWIAEEAGGSNVAYTIGAPYSVIPDPGGALPRFTTLQLSKPFPVVAGMTYRFILDKLDPPGIINIRCTGATPPADYIGGSATDDSGLFTNFDLDFVVNIGPPATVPVISPLGAALLIFVLLIIGTIALRRRSGIGVS